MRRFFYLPIVSVALCFFASTAAYGAAWAMVTSGYTRPANTPSGIANFVTGQWGWPSQEIDGVLCTQNHCRVGVCAFQRAYDPKDPYSGGVNFTCNHPEYQVDTIEVPYKTTFKQAQALYVAKNGTSGSWSTNYDAAATPNYPTSDTCFTMMYWSMIANPGLSDWSGQIIPGAHCSWTPPLPSSCTSLPDMNFDHGIIEGGSNLQDKVNVSATLACTGTTYVELSLLSSLDLDPGIVNHLYVNNQLLGLTPVRVDTSATGKTPLIFSSVIESATSGGKFTASTVLLVDMF